jgi:hypothetical protein
MGVGGAAATVMDAAMHSQTTQAGLADLQGLYWLWMPLWVHVRKRNVWLSVAESCSEGKDEHGQQWGE